MENQKRLCVAICFGSSNHFTGLIGNLSLPCRRIGQGHARVMIYINFVELHFQMLLSFKNICLLVLEKNDFKGFCYL